MIIISKCTLNVTLYSGSDSKSPHILVEHLTLNMLECLAHITVSQVPIALPHHVLCTINILLTFKCQAAFLHQKFMQHRTRILTLVQHRLKLVIAPKKVQVKINNAGIARITLLTIIL